MDNNFNGNNGNPQNDYGQQPMNQQPDYSQQPMNQQPDYSQQPMNQQMYYGQQYAPAPDMGGNGEPPKVKKPMSNGKIAGIVCGSIALVALIVCGVIFLPRLFKSDKEVVIDAFENTFDADAKEQDNDDIFGSDDIMTAYSEKGGNVNMTISLDEAGGEAMDLSLSTVQNVDQKNKRASQSFSAAYQDKDFFNYDMFIDEENIYMNIADMFDGYLALPSKNTGEAIANSPLGEYLGQAQMLFGDFNYFGEEDSEGTEIYSGYVNAVEKLWDSVTFEKQGKAKINVNGRTVTAKEYYVTLSEKNIEEAICSALDGVSEMMAANPSMYSDLGMTAENFNVYLEQIKRSVPSLVTDDFVVKVYIKDKKVVKITSAANVNIVTLSVGYDFYLDIDDNDVSCKAGFSVAGEEVGIKFDVHNLQDKPNGTMAIYMPENRIDVSFEIKEKSDEKLGATADVKYNGEAVCNLTLNRNLSSDNAFATSLVLDIVDMGVIDLVYEGRFQNIEKGVKFTAVMDKLDVNVDGEKMLGMSGEYTIDTSSVAVSEMDSSMPVYELVNMTEADFENFVLDNQDNILTWMQNFIDNSGIIGELINGGSGYDIQDDDSSGTGTVSGTDTDNENDMMLVQNDIKVKILGCIDGFKLSNSSQYYIYFYTNDYSMVEYSIYTKTTVDDVVAGMNMPSDDVEIYNKIENQTLDVENYQVKYSMVQYDSYDYKVSDYLIAREISDGVVLVVNASIYDDDDSYTVEQLAQALGDQYFEIVSE